MPGLKADEIDIKVDPFRMTVSTHPAKSHPEHRYIAGSYEAAFHDTEIPGFLLNWREHPNVPQILREPRLERAIGVIYRPDSERASHYFHARLTDQFDAVLHFDETRALEPLDHGVQWQTGEVSETFPFAV